MADRNLNPSNYKNINDIEYVSIDVSKYKGKSIYGDVGTKASGKSNEIMSKLNHRTKYDPDDKLGAGASPKNPYVYIKEDRNGKGGDYDSEPWISKVRSGFGSENARNVFIGSFDGTARTLNGDTNRDTIHNGSGSDNNEFMYNAGNIDDYQTNLYDDNDLITGGFPAVIKTNEEGKLRRFKDGKWEEISSTDPRNTSNTMNKTMNAYSVTVKPMNVRNL